MGREVVCSICGEDLGAGVDGSAMKVDPCTRCFEEAKQEAHTAGYTVGQHAGHAEGCQAERARQERR